jgi:hypothetical protein
MSWLLVLTSSLHYLAVIPIILTYQNKPLPFFNRIYRNTILYSTTISILWHFFNETYKLVFLDYGLAIVWFIQDVLWSFLLSKPSMIHLNIIIFILHFLVRYTGDYVLYHSIWHVISSIKCLYISYVIKHYDI